MYPRGPRIERLRLRARIAMAGIIGFGLAGCAGESTLKQGSYPAAVAPYEGVFAGEFVDGKPLYRLPTIEVVGSRRRGAEGT